MLRSACSRNFHAPPSEDREDVVQNISVRGVRGLESALKTFARDTLLICVIPCAETLVEVAHGLGDNAHVERRVRRGDRDVARRRINREGHAGITVSNCEMILGTIAYVFTFGKISRWSWMSIGAQHLRSVFKR